jgi:ATP-dependent RNA helicase RhlE
VNQKEKAYQVWRLLTSKGFHSATYIHSDLPQETREQAVADFKSGKYRVIVATDVMGRGIDVDDVSHVINYDVPREAADYVHRIGRTGRRGLTGRATTFAIPRVDEMSIRGIEKLKGIESPEIPKQKPQDKSKKPSRSSAQAPRSERRPRPEGERRPRPEGERRPRPEGERKSHHDRGPRRNQGAQAPREQQPQQLAQTPGSEASKVGVIQKITKFFSKLLVK